MFYEMLYISYYNDLLTEIYVYFWRQDQFSLLFLYETIAIISDFLITEKHTERILFEIYRFLYAFYDSNTPHFV